MDKRKRDIRLRWLSALIMLVLAMPVFPSSPASAQAGSRLFPETGKTVRGKFLAYWDTHGGLAQQGFPISEEMQEKSETDGKTYKVQYFERAVFEEHPENPAPNDVLLSLLGNFLYKQKYAGNAPGQQVNTDLIFQDFRETGKRVGGKFLQYWRTHGGLAQQGFPISEEFTEVSPLDGKPYRVQYFERAVFELHPEFKGTPNEVLLSQLGRFRYDQLYKPGGQPTPGGTQPTPTTRPGGNPPPPTSTPAAQACTDNDVPQARNATVTPRCGYLETTFDIRISGFRPNEKISFWFTAPNGDTVGTRAPLEVGQHNGRLEDYTDGEELKFVSDEFDVPLYGIWAISYEGEESHNISIVWFKLAQKSGR